MNQVEKAIGMDLNGDGRIGGGTGQTSQYPPNYNQYGGAPGPQYGGGPGYGQNPHQGGGGGYGYGQNPQQGGGGGMGGGLMNQLEKATGIDLDGNGRVGGSGPGQNQYGPRY